MLLCYHKHKNISGVVNIFSILYTLPSYLSIYVYFIVFEIISLYFYLSTDFINILTKFVFYCNIYSKEVIKLDIYIDLIRKRIKEKFGTIENFSKHIDIPRTTINFILKKGISSSNYGMVNKILKELDIYPVDSLPIVIDDKLLAFIKIYNALDDIGKHTVTSVAETEYRRVHSDSLENAIIAAYGSISSSKPLTNDEKLILDLIERIKIRDNNDK